MAPDLKATVSRALTNAIANGFEADLRAMSAEDLAADLREYDADLEGVALCFIVPLARKWLAGESV